MKRLMLIHTATILLYCLFACSKSGDEAPTPNPPTTPSQLHMPVFLSDGMVVQQHATATYWGTTNPHATLQAEASWHNKPITTVANEWGQWQLQIPTPSASKTLQQVVITDSHNGRKVISDILIGEVWFFAGQSNMEMPMRGFGSVANGNYQPVANAEQEIAEALSLSHFRYFKVKYQAANTPQSDVKANTWWRASIPTEAREFSAIAFFCGRKLATTLDIPIGIICAPYGGTRIEAWMPIERLRQFDPDDYKDASELSADAAKKSAPGLLYNGMVHPLNPYTIRGFAWYQGESNRDTAQSYARLQQAMVEEWRKAKGDTDNSLPFYYVQISGIGTNLDTYGSKLIEAQWDAQKLIPNSDLITTSDVGDSEFVHYPNKRTPGERLARLMLYRTYGVKSINPYGPQVASIRYTGGKAIVTFANGKGMYATQAPIPFVQVAGSDKKFYTATASLNEAGELEASSPSVTAPKTIRYCFTSWHQSTLFNEAGVPLAPFRSDR